MRNTKANVIPVIIGQLKIFHKVPEQHTGKARNQGITKNSRSTKHSAWGVTLHVPYILTTE